MKVLVVLMVIAVVSAAVVGWLASQGHVPSQELLPTTVGTALVVTLVTGVIAAGRSKT